MTQDSQTQRLLQEISQLPQGNITYKTIRGKKRMYLQWTEDGKSRSRYVKAAEESAVSAAVARRKSLEEELRLLSYQTRFSAMYTDQPSFETRVLTGPSLLRLTRPVHRFRPRECIKKLKAYLSSDSYGRVCLIYGLRRTGKTTLILQAITDLPVDQTAYIKILKSDTMAALNRDLQKLSDSGFQYIFIDEITLMKDFIDSASLLSDVYAMFGMKLVLSGTDSLGFALSAGHELYDRAVTIHTTFIPFREYASLLGIHDIDAYIRYGGTFRMGETDFDDPELIKEEISFQDDESTRRYIDSAIAKNIQHSLACYQSGDHFRHLLDLYEARELTSAVNRIIEDMNHYFLVSVLTRDFLSHDLGVSARNMRKQAAMERKKSVLDQIDTEQVTKRLRHILDIKNKPEMKVTITADHVREIKEYLQILDLISDCPSETIGNLRPTEHILFSQPGMRYCQAQALVFSVMKDEVFLAIPAEDRSLICDRILEEVRGRLMEEIVLLETAKASGKDHHVFKLQFDIGEFDMVIYNRQTNTCQIFEIKHSSQVFPAQYRHLIDPQKCADTEFHYGKITAKTVLYRGKDCEMDGILYRNVESYLEALHN